MAADYDKGDRIGGDVYHAKGPGGRASVLKWFLPGAEQCFRAVRAIVHPHLVRVIDAGTDDGGPWIAMPYVDGMALSDPFRGPLSVRATLVLVHPVLEGLAALHAAGLVHGDIRPENVLVTPTGDVTIVDPGFGFVRSKRLCHPPEHFEGRELDAGADVWAVGVLLHRLLTGELPFDGEGAIREGTYSPPAGVPDELAWIVSICLARNSWARPLDAGALLARITPLVPCPIGALREERMALLSDPHGYDQRVTGAPAPRARPVPSAAHPRLRRRRSPWPFAVVALAILAMIAIAFVWIDGSGPPRPPSHAERPERTAPRRSVFVPLRLSSIPNNLPPMTSGLSSFGEPERAPALVAIRAGRYELAEQMLGRSIAIDPDDVDSRVHRGVLRHRLGRARDAYGDLTSALDEEPDNSTALAELAQLYARAGHARESEPLLRRILLAEPANVDAWIDLSIALGPSADGARAIERAVELAPASARANRERCLVLVRAQRTGAADACTQAIELTPEDSALFLARAEAHTSAGRHAQGIDDIDRAIALAPNDGSAFHRRSVLRSRVADDGGAFRDLVASCNLGWRPACDEMRERGVTPDDQSGAHRSRSE